MQTFKQFLSESRLTGEAMRKAADEVRRHLPDPQDFRSFAQDYTHDGNDIVWELRIEYSDKDNELLSPRIYEKVLERAIKASGVDYKDMKARHTPGTKPATQPELKFCRISVKVSK